MSTITVTNAAALSVALAAASGDTRIELAPGDYGDVALWDVDIGGTLTIASADPDARATIGKLEIKFSQNIVLEDLDFAASGPDDLVDARLIVDQSENVLMRGLDITGAIPDDTNGADPDDPETGRAEPIAGWPHDFGVKIQGSTDVTLEDSTLSDLRVSVTVKTSQNVMMSGLDISEVREGINFSDSQSVTITGSYFHDFNPWIGNWEPGRDGAVHDHADMIQYWGLNSQTGLSDITISDNVFTMPEGEYVQTIFGHMNGAPDGVIAEDFTVTGNLILNAQTHGITLSGLQSGLVANNVILPNIEAQFGLDVPEINVSDGTANLTISGNVTVTADGGDVIDLDAAGRASQNITVTDDNLVLSNTPLAEDYWADWWASQTLSEAWAQWIDDPVAASDPGGPIQTIEGSAGYDEINGTAASELIISGAGNNDRMWGGAGDAADYFLIGDETWNGTLEWDQIQGFDWRYDALVLGEGVSVDRMGNPYTGRVNLRFEGDDDGARIFGEGLTSGNLTILSYEEFEDLQQTPPPVEIHGTEAAETLTGTEVSEVFYSGAGKPDRLNGGAGDVADYFVFSAAEASNGQEDRDIIYDFQWQYDALVLGDGVTIDRMSSNTANRVGLRLDGDNDALTIYGDGLTLDNLTILTLDEAGLA